jgi:hypothetical protein
MATIQDLFKEQKKELYGLSGTLLIESRGIINAPRGAALLTSTPDTLADLIGNQIGGALGGNPNRVSDTIFRKPTGFRTKPITLPAVTQALLRDSVDTGEDYYIKPAPAPASIIGKIKQGGSSPAGAAAALAASALNTFGSKKAINKLKEALKKEKENKVKSYGAKYTHSNLGSKQIRDEDITFTKKQPEYGQPSDGRNQVVKPRPGELAQIGVKDREVDKTFDKNENAILNSVLVYDDALSTWKKDNNKANIVNVTIKPYGKDYNIILPGTISGISEDVSNEINNFKYVGSPFNTYRYTGVERTLKFDIKLYYTTQSEKMIMITKINSLKELMFPYDEISEITYGEGTGKVSQMAFAPNLIYLTIDGLYNSIFGIMDTLSISIDDNVSWVMDDGMTKNSNNKDKAYPSVVNINFGMKIIETPTIDQSGGKTRFKYNFDGNGIDTASQIDFTNKELKKIIDAAIKAFSK